MKKTRKLLLSLLVFSTPLSATGCSAVSMSIKAKGDQVSPIEWSTSFQKSFEDNLDIFNNSWFDVYSLLSTNTLGSSITVKHTKQTKYNNKKETIKGSQKTLKAGVNNKTVTTSIYDVEHDSYSETAKSTVQNKSHDGINYSTSESSMQVQMFEKTVYKFDLVEMKYSSLDYENVSQLAAVRLQSIYNRFYSVYELLKISGDSFGKQDIYKNSKFFTKGNVFTIVTTYDYATTLSIPTNYSKIEGVVENTRQYIIEKSNLTYTEFNNYKKCSTIDKNEEYKYSLNREDGETISAKLKGSVKKVYREDFYYVS